MLHGALCEDCPTSVHMPPSAAKAQALHQRGALRCVHVLGCCCSVKWWVLRCCHCQNTTGDVEKTDNKVGYAVQFPQSRSPWRKSGSRGPRNSTGPALLRKTSAEAGKSVLRARRRNPAQQSLTQPCSTLTSTGRSQGYERVQSVRAAQGAYDLILGDPESLENLAERLDLHLSV